MFYNRGEVLSDQFDHFKLILFWVPECSFFFCFQRFIDLHTFKNWREGQCRKVHSRLELVGVHSVKTVYRRRSMGGKPIAQDCSITPLQQ